MKQCNGPCGLSKNENEFNKKKDTKDRLRAFCKSCQTKKWQQYYENNKEYRLKKNNEWRKNNNEYMRNYTRKYQKEKRDNDPSYRLRQNIGRAIRKCLEGAKNKSITKLLPYSIDELKQHLEKTFSSEMSWNNYGKVWEIDHIYPQSKLIYETTEDENFLKCWRLTNLQALSITDNRKKSNKLLINNESSTTNIAA